MQSDFPMELLAGPVVSPWSIAEWYHENTKLHSGDEPLLSHARHDHVVAANRLCLEQEIAEGEEFVALHSKNYETATVVPLPNPTLPAAFSMRQALEQRRSDNQFTSSNFLNLDHLSTLLYYGYGLNEKRCSSGIVRRHVPSAGALFPLEIYLITVKLDGQEPGSLFHYRARGHSLELLGHVPGKNTLHNLFAQSEVREAAVAIFISGCLPRLTWKYGERGYRYLLLEAGHVGQNLCLVSSALGLAACPVVGFYDDAVHDLFLLDGVSESVLYSVCVGVCISGGVETPEWHQEEST